MTQEKELRKQLNVIHNETELYRKRKFKRLVFWNSFYRYTVNIVVSLIVLVILILVVHSC